MSNIKRWEMLEKAAEKAQNDGWPSREDLPTGDPIGDVCDKKNESILPIKNGVFDPYADGYKQWKKDQENYENTMKPHLKKPEGKLIESVDFIVTKIYLDSPLKCNCGTEKVFGKVPLKSHSHYCDLVKGQK